MTDKDHKFIETFTDIDDKYIADAKPAAQETSLRPIMLKPETRRPSVWRKITAAAACVAVLGAGSFAAVKIMNSHNAATLTSHTSLPDFSGAADSGNTSANLFSTEIEYMDMTYEVVNAAVYDGVKISVAFNRKSYGRGAHVYGVVEVENTTDKPIVLSPNAESIFAGVKVTVDGLLAGESMVEQGASNLIRPGEVRYQQISFDTCTQEFTDVTDRFRNYKTALLAPAGRYNGTAVLEFLPDADDPDSEVISRTMDFSIDVEDWNVGDSIGGYVKENNVEKQLEEHGSEIFTIRDDFPGVEFECDFKSISLINEDGSRTRLFGGGHIANYCISDLNNDGYGEIIASVNVDIMRDYKTYDSSTVYVYDHANKMLYASTHPFERYTGEYINSDNGTSGYGRVMIAEYTLDDNHELISEMPLTFDMLHPVIDEHDGMPIFRPLDTLKYNNGDEFEYDGKIYRVMDTSIAGSTDFYGEFKEGTIFVVGVRREIIDGVDTVEFAAFVENFGTEFSKGLMSSTASPDKPILFRFEPNDESIDTHHVFDDYEFKYLSHIIQPGEKYFQTASFPVTEEEYMFSVCWYGTDPEKFDESESFSYNQNGGHLGNRWVDFSDKSVSFDDVYELFGASNLSKELAKAHEAAAEAHEAIAEKN